jgi:hypothetical protein
MGLFKRLFIIEISNSLLKMLEKGDEQNAKSKEVLEVSGQIK